MEVLSPESRKPSSGNEKNGIINKVRRRLSLVSNNELIEGFETEGIEEALANMDVTSNESAVTEYAGYSRKGFAPYNPRKKNQDAIIMTPHKQTNSLLLTCLDGHGEHGDGVAQYFKKEIPRLLFKDSHFAQDIGKALTRVIAKSEKRLIHDGLVDTDFSGTTLVTGVVREEKLTIANVGDSRIIIGKSDGNEDIMAEALSQDHKPDLPDEKERILKAGGRVFAVEYDDGVDGPPRVWLGHMDIPGLAMSRSLGDVVAHSAGVSSTPDIITRDLNRETDKFLILATDGLWEFVSDQEAVDIVKTCEDPHTAVENLIKESCQRWLSEEQVIDDVTVCVAFLYGWKGM